MSAGRLSVYSWAYWVCTCASSCIMHGNATCRFMLMLWGSYVMLVCMLVWFATNHSATAANTIALSVGWWLRVGFTVCAAIHTGRQTDPTPLMYVHTHILACASTHAVHTRIMVAATAVVADRTVPFRPCSHGRHHCGRATCSRLLAASPLGYCVCCLLLSYVTSQCLWTLHASLGPWPQSLSAPSSSGADMCAEPITPLCPILPGDPIVTHWLLGLLQSSVTHLLELTNAPYRLYCLQPHLYCRFVPLHHTCCSSC